jgi:hypothetical protein
VTAAVTRAAAAAAMGVAVWVVAARAEAAAGAALEVHQGAYREGATVVVGTVAATVVMRGAEATAATVRAQG